jgi:hypothetical protein
MGLFLASRLGKLPASCYTGGNGTAVPGRVGSTPGVSHREVAPVTDPHYTQLPFDPQEEWRPVAGWAGLYEVSDLGRVRSWHTGSPRVMKSSPSPRYGHRRLTLERGTVKQKYFVHRLVLETFRGLCPAGKQCAHLDGDASNNRLSNLAWVTQRENEQHKVWHGRVARGTRQGAYTKPETVRRGEAQWNAKLTDERVRRLRVLAAEGATPRELAVLFGVDRATVRGVLAGRRWRHVR